MTFPPYERIVQWLAGPFAAFIGLLATKAVTHFGFLGSAGLQQSSVAHGITEGAVFVTTALVTYAAHHKWLTNLSKWWDAIGIGNSNPPETVQPVIDPAPVLSGDPVEALRAQLANAGITPKA